MTGPAEFDISDTEDGLRLTGELDAHTAPQLAEAIERLDLSRVVIDMAAVDFVDSSGLRVLIRAHQSADERGRKIALANPSDAVTRLLEISGVDGYLDVV